MKKSDILMYQKRVNSVVSAVKPLEHYLILKKSQAISLLQNKEELINLVWKKCLIIIQLLNKKPLLKKEIIYILESPVENSWMILIDKLNTSEICTLELIIFLLKTLVQELILKEKDFKPFWTPAYKELSEKLLSAIKTECPDLLLISSNPLLQSVEEKLQLSIKKTVPLKLNLQKIYCPLSLSLIVDKWEKGDTPVPKKLFKTLTIKIFPTLNQQQKLKKFFDVNRFIYNKSVALFNSGFKINKYSLRNKLVPEFSKTETPDYLYYSELIKNEKDPIKKKLLQEQKKQKLKNVVPIKNKLQSFELEVPTEIRKTAVFNFCDALKTNHTNLKHRNIKYFKMKFKRKKSNIHCLELAKSLISIKKSKVQIQKMSIKMSKKNQKKYTSLKITANVDVIKNKNGYYLNIPVPISLPEITTFNKVIAIDPGVRTLLTGIGTAGITEYNCNTIFDKINFKRKVLTEKIRRIRKKEFNRIEIKKKNLTDELHWKTISDLIKYNDLIFFGDIKSHSITKNNKNKNLNKSILELNFFKFKQRLKWYSLKKGKKVVFINEFLTSKTCSNCGNLKDIKNSKIYNCDNCKTIIDRDINSAFNILFKGLLFK